MPTTIRIALLAGLLVLVSNLAVVGFIYGRTHDEAVSTIRSQVVEQGRVFTRAYRTNGSAGLHDAVDDALAFGGPETIVGLLDKSKHTRLGNIAALGSENVIQEGYDYALVRLKGDTTPVQAALVTYKLPTGEWLISGRVATESLAIRQTVERSLLLALVIAGLLGLLCGIILAKYVANRVAAITAVANRISGRDLSQRVPVSGAGDSFDRLAVHINAMLDRISALMAELRLLTDSLAHDLRSPVSRLRAAAQSAAEAADPVEQERLLTSVVRNADALIRILTTVLEISRSESQAGRNQFTWFNAAELTAELAEMYDPLADDAGLALNFANTNGPIQFFGHRQLLAQAISNLIENAIRYGASGGVINMSVGARGSGMVVEVADHGPGIPPARRDEARRRFGRLDSSRSTEGAGLGLALVDSIARLHDGDLLLDDNGPGLRAQLLLPGNAVPDKSIAV